MSVSTTACRVQHQAFSHDNIWKLLIAGGDEKLLIMYKLGRHDWPYEKCMKGRLKHEYLYLASYPGS